MAKNELFERRKYRRVKVDAEIKYREVVSNDFLNENRDFLVSKLVDVSRGGMQFFTGHAWEKDGDKLIEAEFELRGKLIRLIAHIVWSLRGEMPGEYRVGAEFIVVKSGDLEVISQMS